jgi:dsRNA-specific ribonuclease
MRGKAMGLDHCAYAGEKGAKGRSENKRLADMVEAIIGAVYLDGGMNMVKQVLSKMALV